MDIRIGFGRRCITPEESVPLAGLGNTSRRMSTNVRDDLYASCIAFSSQEETVLLITLDLLHASPDWTQKIRSAITEACDIPGDHIMVAHTHTHSAPDMYNHEKACIPVYSYLLASRTAQAAIDALNDCRPAKIYTGSYITPEHMNHVRNYTRDADDSTVLRHAGEPDPQLQMVKICREEAKDILLMNWQAHPCLTSGMDKTDISADYVGEVRKYLEDKTDCHFAFFQGAAGNVNIRSRIKGETITMDPVLYGQLLGDCALKALEQLKLVPGHSVRMYEKTQMLSIDHSDDFLVPAAQKVHAHWIQTYDKSASDAIAKSYGMNSTYHANGILNRSRKPQSVEMVMNVFSVGEIAFVCAPFEMYCENGIQLKQTSPFQTTVVVTCCNTLHGYLASDMAFDYGCYEVDFRRYPRGTAEQITALYVSMLKQLKEADSV